MSKLLIVAEMTAYESGTPEGNLIELEKLADEIARSTTLSYEYVVEKLYCMASKGWDITKMKEVTSTWRIK